MPVKKINKQDPKFLVKDPFIIFPRLVKWLAYITLNVKSLPLLLQVLDKILTIYRTRGPRDTIRYCKDIRLRIYKLIFSFSEPFKPNRKHWFPKSVKPLIDQMIELKSYPFVRLVLSVFYISRFIKGGDPEQNFDTILRRPLYKGDPRRYRSLIFIFLRDLGLNTKTFGRVPRSLRFSSFHMTSKSGPNGHALWNSYRDLEALLPHEIYNISKIGGEKLTESISQFNYVLNQLEPDFFARITPYRELHTSRRLSVIHDKEGKTREVAIVSYYEQAALLPLHKYLMKLLSRIHQDCTSNQTKLFYDLKAPEGHSYHSIDLTAFTDRFPIKINKEILSVLFGEEYASNWRSLMVDKPFHYNGRSIFYRCGNPMGAYSSWASTTLAHHFFVWLACKKAKIHWKECPYMLLGDDIVIAHDNVAKAYKDLLLEWSIEFSPQKTHTSKVGFEFAKQIRIFGENVTPFPLSALYDRITEPLTGLAILISEITTKGWEVDILQAVSRYYTEVVGWTFPYFKDKKPKLFLTVALVLFLQGRADLGYEIHRYVASRGIKLPPWFEDPESPAWRHEVALWVLESMKAVFKENRDQVINTQDGRTLGMLSQEIFMDLGMKLFGVDFHSHINSIPFMNVFGRAESKLFALLYHQDNIDEVVTGQFLWYPETFRSLIEAVDIPLSDKGYYTRHRDVIVNRAMRVTDHLVTKIESELCKFQ